MTPHVYFSIPARHPFMAKLKVIDAYFRASLAEWAAFCTSIRLPDPQYITSRDRLVGFDRHDLFVKQPTIWRWVPPRRGSPGFATPRQTGDGKPLAKRLAALPPLAKQNALEDALGLPGGLHFDGRAIVHLHLLRPKGKPPILGVPLCLWQEHAKAFKGMKELSSREAAEAVAARTAQGSD